MEFFKKAYKQSIDTISPALKTFKKGTINTINNISQ